MRNGINVRVSVLWIGLFLAVVSAGCADTLDESTTGGEGELGNSVDGKDDRYGEPAPRPAVLEASEPDEDDEDYPGEEESPHDDWDYPGEEEPPEADDDYPGEEEPNQGECIVDELLMVARAYNVLVGGDFTAGYSDTEGWLAAGGDLTVWHYSIALLNADDTGAVVGGDAEISDASVHGDLAAQGRVTLNNAGLYHSGGRGRVQTDLPFAFSDVMSDLRVASAELADWSPTGTTEVTSWYAITLTGSSHGMNVFDVNARDISRAVSLTIDVPYGADVLINVAGSDPHFGNFAIFPTDLDPSRVLFNAPDATAIQIEAFAFTGSLLAPWASIDFDNGQFNGSLWAGEHLGDGYGDGFPDGQFNHRPNRTIFCSR